MSTEDLLAEANFGKPMANVALTFRLLRRHFQSPEEIMEAGLALHVARLMEAQNWYSTDKGYLVCGMCRREEKIEAQATIDDDDRRNIRWLLEQFRRPNLKFRPNIDGFLVHMVKNRRGVTECTFNPVSGSLQGWK